jgi:hypothetical protein
MSPASGASGPSEAMSLPAGEGYRAGERAETVERPSGPGAEARSFVRLFVLLTVGCLLAQAAFNLLVNPWGLYPTQVLQARLVDERYKKCALLQQAKPRPEQLILGTSRMMRFEPEHLRARTGLSTFNAAIPGAVPVDFLVLYRYAAEAVQAPIKSVVLGVDALVFFEGAANYQAIENNPQLRRFLPERQTLVADVGSLAMLLSPAQSKDSWRSIGHALGWGGGDGKNLWRVFEADGFQSRNYQDPARERAEWRLEPIVENQLKKGYMNPREINPLTFRDFDSLLALLRERGVETLVVLTPAVDTVREHWQRTGFLERERSIREQITTLARDRGARLVDFSAVESFGGDPREFYDSIHPTVPNTRRMIDALFPPAA